MALRCNLTVDHAERFQKVFATFRRVFLGLAASWCFTWFGAVAFGQQIDVFIESTSVAASGTAMVPIRMTLGPNPTDRPSTIQLTLPVDPNIVDLAGPLTVVAGPFIPLGTSPLPPLGPPFFLPSDVFADSVPGQNAIRITVIPFGDSASTPDICHAALTNQASNSIFCTLFFPIKPGLANGTSMTMQFSGVPDSPIEIARIDCAGGSFAFFTVNPNAPVAHLMVTNGPIAPTVYSVYPYASFFGKTVTISGTNFVAGMQVFFGGGNLVPGSNVQVVNATTLTVQVPALGTNPNGFITLTRPGGGSVTTQNLPKNTSHPENTQSTYPLFLIWGDTDLNGDIDLDDFFRIRRVVAGLQTPTQIESLLLDMFPINPNGSRGAGGQDIDLDDFIELRKVVAGFTP